MKVYRLQNESLCNSDVQLTWVKVPNAGADPAEVPDVIQQMWNRIDRGQRPYSRGEEEKAREEPWLGPKIDGIEMQKGKSKSELLKCLFLVVN